MSSTLAPSSRACFPATINGPDHRMSPADHRHDVAAQFYISDFTSSLLSVVCQPSSALKINGRTFNVIKLLGEGGFSFVYLATDVDSQRTFALKKIRAPNAETVKIAMAEIEAYRRFKSDNIIKSERPRPVLSFLSRTASDNVNLVLGFLVSPRLCRTAG